MRSVLKTGHKIYANISSSGFVVFCLIICKVFGGEACAVLHVFWTQQNVWKPALWLWADLAPQPDKDFLGKDGWVCRGKGGRRRGEECGHIRWCFWKGMPGGCAYFCSLHINYGFFWMKRSHLWHWSEKFSGSEFGKSGLMSRNSRKMNFKSHMLQRVSVCSQSRSICRAALWPHICFFTVNWTAVKTQPEANESLLSLFSIICFS